MSEIKWIKITTEIFDNEKIKIIDQMPAQDEMLVVWFKLLVLAGKSNQGGMLFMSEKIPYTIEMLAAVFNRKEKTIRLALSVFERYGMVTIEDNEIISITNWEKHQNVGGMDKIREQSRKRVAMHRANKKQLLAEGTSNNKECNVSKSDCNATSNVTVTQCYETDIDIDIDKEKERDIEGENHNTSTLRVPFNEIFDFYNQICFSLPKVQERNEKRKRAMRALWKSHPDIAYFTELFQRAEASDFLTGKVNEFRANYDWIIKNHEKIIEGNYDGWKRAAKSANQNLNTIDGLMNSDVAKDFLEGDQS